MFSASTDPAFRERVQRQVEELARRSIYHSLELPGGVVVPGLIPIEALQQRLASFPLPADLKGRRVLDVGAASGWNTFEVARRGAAVVSIDCVEYPELRQSIPLFDAEIDYRILDVDELSRETIGTFDYVIFFGVLYHLRHPLAALERICAMTRDTAFVESFVTDAGLISNGPSTLEFYERDELGGQIDNWFGPNVNCLAALCRSAGFARVRLEYVAERRAGFTCSRKWEPEPDAECTAGCRLYSAVNNRTNDGIFHAGKDEYLCVYFKFAGTNLSPDDLRIEIDGFGVPCITLKSRGDDEWQANARIPPGLDAGEHQIRVRTAGTRFSNATTIVMADRTGQVSQSPQRDHDTQLPNSRPGLYRLENSLDRSTVFHGFRTERLSCRFRLAVEHLDRNHVLVKVDDEPGERPVTFLTNLDRYDWQATVTPPVLPEGLHSVRVRTITSEWSEPLTFERRAADDHAVS